MTFESLAFATLILGSTLGLAPSPDDDLDRAIRAVMAWDEMVEGVDYVNTELGQLLPGLTCYTAANLRCMDNDMHCKYVAAGTICVYCDGSGGMWMATNGLCVQNPNDNCLVNPAGNQTKCGKQRRSTCTGVAPNQACPTVATPSNKDCFVKECT